MVREVRVRACWGDLNDSYDVLECDLINELVGVQQLKVGLRELDLVEVRVRLGGEGQGWG